MDQRMLYFYNQELRHLRQMGREFAEEFPKIAKRLDPDSFKTENLCPDPYVERLLEGFAFLAARVQLKIDAEFPAFCQHLLEFVYPHYLAPTPSMTVVRVQPEDCPPEGFVIPRHTILNSALGRGEQTRCKFRTAHEIKLWPVEIAEAQYLPSSGLPEAVRLEAQKIGGPVLKAAIRLRLRTTGKEPPLFKQLVLDSLSVFLSGQSELTAPLYEQLLADAVALAVPLKTAKAGPGACSLIQQKPRRTGFTDDQALLPFGPRSFQGYRLLQEYFAFPERFLFVELTGLADALQRSNERELDLYVLLKREQPKLARTLDASLFSLFCTPAINLFPQRADRIALTHTTPEYQILPDRTRMADLEVYSVEKVTGLGSEREQVFQPFYSVTSGYRQSQPQAYYTLQRRKSLLSSRQRQQGKQTKYAGSETFISLVDAALAPYDSQSLKDLGLELLCTNRDLAHRDRNQFTEFRLEVDAKADAAIQCVAGPTNPKPSTAVAETAWRLISHLSLNYLSLADSADGAAALRELLGLYCDPADEGAQKQIESLLSVTTKNVVRRVDAAGPIVFGRGVEITVKFDESAFEGGSAFLLGAVLEQFFTRYVSLNSFTETVIITDKREIMRWPIRIGQRHTL